MGFDRVHDRLSKVDIQIVYIDVEVAFGKEAVEKTRVVGDDPGIVFDEFATDIEGGIPKRQVHGLCYPWIEQLNQSFQSWCISKTYLACRLSK